MKYSITVDPAFLKELPAIAEIHNEDESQCKVFVLAIDEKGKLFNVPISLRSEAETGCIFITFDSRVTDSCEQLDTDVIS